MIAYFSRKTISTLAFSNDWRENTLNSIINKTESTYNLYKIIDHHFHYSKIDLYQLWYLIIAGMLPLLNPYKFLITL
jgi:hypothetical protein